MARRPRAIRRYASTAERETRPDTIEFAVKNGELLPRFKILDAFYIGRRTRKLFVITSIKYFAVKGRLTILQRENFPRFENVMKALIIRAPPLSRDHSPGHCVGNIFYGTRERFGIRLRFYSQVRFIRKNNTSPTRSRKTVGPKSFTFLT